MTAPFGLRADDGIELVELLTMVADLCESFPVHIGDMLGSFLGAGYNSDDLRMDAARLAEGLAVAMGFSDASMESDR
jgi:hypothetical protein